MTVWLRGGLLWVGGTAAVAVAGFAPDAAPNVDAIWALGFAASGILFLALHMSMRRTGLLETGLGATAASLWAAGPRPGISGTLALLGTAAVLVSYFLFRLESRIREDREMTGEGRRHTHEAVAFASRRILFDTAIAAAVAWALFHAPILLSRSVSRRWGISFDAASPGITGFLAILFLLVVTGTLLIRLGRSRSDDRSEDEGGFATAAARTDDAAWKGAD